MPVAARMAPIRRDVSAAKVSEVPKLRAARRPRRIPSFTPGIAGIAGITSATRLSTIASSERPGVGKSHAARWPMPRPARRRIFATHSSGGPGDRALVDQPLRDERGGATDHLGLHRVRRLVHQPRQLGRQLDAQLLDDRPAPPHRHRDAGADRLARGGAVGIDRHVGPRATLQRSETGVGGAPLRRRLVRASAPAAARRRTMRRARRRRARPPARGSAGRARRARSGSVPPAGSRGASP